MEVYDYRQELIDLLNNTADDPQSLLQTQRSLTTILNIFELCPYKSRSFSRFYMLEFQYLINIAFYFQCNAVSEISC